MTIPTGFHWNEAELETSNPLNRGLLSLIAFDKDRHPYPIGTGFVLAASDNTAVGCTAAHNFAEVRRIQRPHARHHPSALREFLPAAEPLSVDPRELRAIHFDGSQLEMAVFKWVIADEATDVAFFANEAQDVARKGPFHSEFLLPTEMPAIGAQICVLGYQGMVVSDSWQESTEVGGFTLERKLMLRTGRVIAQHDSGHLLCRGPCIETSIPIFGGMSGAPVALYTEGVPIQPFGLICHDPTTADEDKWDRSISGTSIVALLRQNLHRTDELGLHRVLFNVNATMSSIQAI